MKEYLKMSEVFEGEVKAVYLDGDAIDELVYGDGCGTNWTIEDSGYWLATTYEHARYAAHAINSHDELVAEVERLRKSLKWAIVNLPFEHPFEWSDEDSHDAHKEAIIASGGTYED